jgi:hypothetical protein
MKTYLIRRIIEGKSIIMAGSSTNNLSEFPGSTIGDVSAIVLQRIPYVGKLHLSPDLDIALMSDFETKARERLQKSVFMKISE